MTGAHLLIAAIILALVAAFVITMLVLNNSAKKLISANTKLVENQNTLLEQNKRQGSELEKRTDELEEQRTKLEAQQSELEEQKEMIETLLRQQQDLAKQLQQTSVDEVTLLREQTRQHREHIEQTADMTDEELMVWVDRKMDETLLFKDSDLTLKVMANALGLTQKRLGGLFKSHAKYASLGDYLNEKRFLYACRLLREEPHWTIEAVGAEAGFGGRRTFQVEVKRRLGITPLQYRQSQAWAGENEE
jgi:AraC-like DNA-binding protein